MHGKVDVEIIYRVQSIDLFSMHAFTTNNLCLLYLKDVANKIFNTCSVLLLNLEVLDIYLNINKILRICK